MRSPSELYHNSPRKYQGGQITWHNQELFVSSSLAGWSVSLKFTLELQIEVWFARLLLGWIDPATASFFRAHIRPKKTKNKHYQTIT